MDLRELYPEPKGRSVSKEIDHLDGHCARFIALSPLCVVATTRAGAGPDLSPRGGEPGWATVVDEHTLVLPDRPGNNRLDTLTNVTGTDDRVAILFMVPGIDETLRVYGRATIQATPGVAKQRSVLEVAVDRAFFHCAKALMRSHLWDPDRHVRREDFPTMAEIIADHSGMDVAPETQESMVQRYLPDL